MRTAKSVIQRNLQVGSYAPLTIRAADSQGATARAVEQLGLSRLSLAGVDATPEQLIDLATHAGETTTDDDYAVGDEWTIDPDADLRPEPNEDERSIEYEDYREGLADRYLRPDFVDWHRDRE